MSKDNRQDKREEILSDNHDYMFSGPILTHWWDWIIFLFFIIAGLAILIGGLSAYFVYPFF